ncbi:uncharacterized protein LOC124898575 [Capsicum annuum]|uniref:uncharacterized protein LOC124898575 n=1 Tax=Capsicum annuum TaxID=4072 RepID=UPI001FB13D22|nr:uncharacterized protein LOC124898575 [Capsicum annuum]
MTTSSTSTVGVFEEFTVFPTHLFYILPSDNSGTHLVSPPFDGSSFVIWQKNMLTALSAKNKLGIVIGSVPKPATNSPYISFYEWCNDMIIVWITNSLSPDIATSVMCFDTAKVIWSDINERFGQSNGTKYIQIQKEISSTTQRSSSIANYFTRLRNLWDELNTSYVGPGPSLKKQLEIGKAANGLFYLNVDSSSLSSFTCPVTTSIFGSSFTFRSDNALELGLSSNL